MTTYLTPLVLGLASSLHCIGMCSPLAMTVSRSGRGIVARNLLYNAGRIITYSLFGAIFGFIGMGFSLVGLQEWVSIAAGVLILAVGIFEMRIALPAAISKPIISFSNSIKKMFSLASNSSGPLGVLYLGIINGLLPCGMTALALAYCVTLNSSTEGLAAMFLFGIGTLPAMAGFVILARSLVAKTRLSYRTIQICLLIISGILLIGRGLELTADSGGVLHGAGIVVCGDASD